MQLWRDSRFASASPSKLRLKPRRRKQTAARRRAFLLETLETRCLLATSDWTNPFYIRDVSNDGVVSPLDALIGINEIDNPKVLTGFDSSLPDRSNYPGAFYYDVNGDNSLSPIDVLIVINALNEDRSGPTITVGLTQDTAVNGGTDSDGVTSDARVSGRVLDDLTGVLGLQVQVDEGQLMDVTFGRDGAFSFDPGLLPGDATDKLYSLKFIAEDGRRFSRSASFSFTFDATAPRLRRKFRWPPQAIRASAIPMASRTTTGPSSRETPARVRRSHFLRMAGSSRPPWRIAPGN